MKYILLSLLFSFTINANAQHILKGNVIDRTNKEIPYLNIRVLTADSTFVYGTITDSIGNFSLKGIQPGSYLLVTSCIGYIPLYTPILMPDKDLQIPPIIMEDENIALEEVTIKGASFIRLKDRVLIIPDKQEIKHGSTGYDLLYNLMIPGIDVDKRKGSVTGLNGGVSLYINGQKADFREVQSLRPRDIEKVEYFEMPTGKYAGETSVINYITKLRETGGYVSMDGTQNIGYLKGDYNLASKISHKNTDYTLFGGYSMNRYTSNKQEREIFHFENRDTYRDIDTFNALTKNNNQYIQLNIDNRTEQRTLSSKTGLARTDAPDNYIDKDIIYNKEEGGKFNSNNASDQRGLMPFVNLYGHFQLTPKKALDIYLKGSYTKNEYSRRYTEEKYKFFTDVKEQLYSIDFTGNYNVQLKHQNSTGIQLTHLHQVSSSNYTGDYVNWSHLWTAETLLTAQYNQQIGNKFMLSLQGGVDILNYRIHGDKHNFFLSPYYNIMMNYRIETNQSLLFTFNRGNSNPPINMVSAVDQSIDSLQVQRGNPTLDKANYYVAFLMYSLQIGKFNFEASGYWFGVMPTISYNYFIENEKLINSYHTDGDYHQIRAGLSTSYKANQNLRFKATGYYQYYKMTGKFAADQAEWIFSLDANYYWKDFAFNIYGKSTSRIVSMYPSYMRSPASYGASVSWNRNNWSLEAGTNNTFSQHNKNIEYLTTEVYQYHRTKYNKTDQATGYIRVAYTFDFGKKASKSQKDVNTMINSAILKSE